jgi:hypothetical protein
MIVYGFSSDYGDWCFLSRADRDKGIVAELKAFGEPLPDLVYWEREVPDELLAQTAYDYLEANDQLLDVN